VRIRVKGLGLTLTRSHATCNSTGAVVLLHDAAALLQCAHSTPLGRQANDRCRVVAVQMFLDAALGTGGGRPLLSSDVLEDGLARLEDAALLLGGRSDYALAEGGVGPSPLSLADVRLARLPRGARVRELARRLRVQRCMAEDARAHAARVLQAAWRARAARLM
jgi:hypothetical protein